MLNAYIDDSGTSELPVLVFAGFCARPAQWEVFSDEWRKVLNLRPRLPYFKAADAFGLSKTFYGWDETERDERVMLLADVIKQHAMYGVIVEAPYALIGEYFRGPKGGYFDVTHMMAFAYMVASVGGGSNRFANGEKVKLILDKSLFKGLTRAMMEKSRDQMGPEFQKVIMWPPAEEDDEEFLPLQAADMLAWPFRQRFIDRLNGQASQPIADRAMAHIGSIPVVHEAIDLTEVQQWSANALGDLANPNVRTIVRVSKKTPKPAKKSRDGKA